MANPQAQLIALGMTRYWRAADGLRLDAGPFVTALEFATGRRATVLGKPASDFFQLAVQLLGCSAAEGVMIGDDIVSDVLAAERAGLRGVLVRTGKFREADLQSDMRLENVINSIADIPAWWRGHSDRLTGQKESP
jgi:HAD superfamily hydrolase (TIGR01458 family)